MLGAGLILVNPIGDDLVEGVGRVVTGARAGQSMERGQGSERGGSGNRDAVHGPTTSQQSVVVPAPSLMRESRSSLTIMRESRIERSRCWTAVMRETRNRHVVL